MNTFTKTALMGATLLSAATMVHADNEVSLTNNYLLTDDLTIAQNAAKVRDFSTLMIAVDAAGLSDELGGEGPYTIFAPTDAAFAELPEGTVENLLLPENRDALIALVSAHVVPASVVAKDFELAEVGEGSIENGTIHATLDGTMVSMDTISQTDLAVKKIGDAYYIDAYLDDEDTINPTTTIIYSDIMSSNGVIHIIDKVLQPGA